MSELGILRVGVVAFSLLLGITPVARAADTPLPFGPTVEGRIGAGTVYKVEIREAGLLSVAARSSEDILIQVTDEDGQLLPEGRIDVDWDGDSGLELGTVAIPGAGAYRIRVEQYGGGGSAQYSLAASFLPFAALARQPDPDGRPSGAVRLAVGEGREGRIHSAAGDLRDWYVVTAPATGTFTVVTRAPGDDVGDLVLEAFLDGDFANAVQRSDQDIQGNRANESVSVNVGSGQVLHLRVSALSASQDPIPYRITAGFLE